MIKRYDNAKTDGLRRSRDLSVDVVERCRDSSAG